MSDLCDREHRADDGGNEEEEEGAVNLFARESDEEAESKEESITLKFDSYSLEKHHLASVLPGVQSIELALLNQHHSLWAEFIYNAARLLADLMIGSSDHSERIFGLPSIQISPNDKCLELGAGAGLPGFVSALCGARHVVISDYGNDLDLNLMYPIDFNKARIMDLMRCHGMASPRLDVVAYTWGYPVASLVFPYLCYELADAALDLTSFPSYKASKLAARLTDSPSVDVSPEDKFDKIFLADLIFNRSEHRKLLWTAREALRPHTGVCYVSFSHHDPAKAPLDMNFFTLAVEEFGFHVDCLGHVVRPTYPFREQDGLDEQRGKVHLYTLRLPS